MNIVNQISIMGNVGSDVKVTQFESGKTVARFSLATNFRHKGETRTEWHDIYAWGNMAKYLEMVVKKGKRMAVHGRMVNKSFIDKKGVERRKVEIEAKHLMSV